MKTKDIGLERCSLINPPEEQHQCAEKGLKIVVLIDVALIIQLDVSKHLQKTVKTSVKGILCFYFTGSAIAVISNLPGVCAFRK